MHGIHERSVAVDNDESVLVAWRAPSSSRRPGAGCIGGLGGRSGARGSVDPVGEVDGHRVAVGLALPVPSARASRPHSARIDRTSVHGASTSRSLTWSVGTLHLLPGDRHAYPASGFTR